MSKEIIRPIYDIQERILSTNEQTKQFDIYPYVEGRVFFDRENQVVYTDVDGQRAARTDVSAIQTLNGNIDEFYERGAKGFENQILVGKTSNGFRLYYVDKDAEIHNLTFTAEEVGDLSQRAANESSTFYYAGEWIADKLYTADAFRVAVVKQNGSFYYIRETHTSGSSFDASKWIKFSAQFESVATGLLLAEDAIITRTLTMGSEVGDPNQFGVIKSSGVVDFNNFGSTNSGFYMDASGKMRFGNPNNSNISWDGSNLSVKGNLILQTPFTIFDVIYENEAGITFNPLQINRAGSSIAGIKIIYKSIKTTEDI